MSDNYMNGLLDAQYNVSSHERILGIGTHEYVPASVLVAIYMLGKVHGMYGARIDVFGDPSGTMLVRGG